LNRLEPIIALARREVERRRAEVPLDQLERAATARAASEPVRPFAQALAAPGLSVIAEHKRRSPSAGVIRADLELEQVVGAYERGGAAALSILTEGPSFGGSLDDLRAARVVSSLPILRKDFIVDPYQLTETFVAGADAILLIVAALTSSELRALHAAASALGLAALVEVHDAAELDVAVSAGAELIGINNRDLTTLEVEVERTFELLAQVPEGTTIVSESGFSRREQLDRLAAAGVDAVLVGEALMRSEDLEQACRMLAL
jgi:indole-3-glycerol phosphate synthase